MNSFLVRKTSSSIYHTLTEILSRNRKWCLSGVAVAFCDSQYGLFPAVNSFISTHLLFKYNLFFSTMREGNVFIGVFPPVDHTQPDLTSPLGPTRADLKSLVSLGREGGMLCLKMPLSCLFFTVHEGR